MADQVYIPPRPEGHLEVSLTCPRMCGYAGPAWPRFCFVYVSFRDKLVCSPKMLPFELDEEDVDEDISERGIRRARVPLLDALVLGDEEEEEEAEDQKRRRSEVDQERHSRVEGTLEFGKTVPLLDWELPAPGGKPRSVVLASVQVEKLVIPGIAALADTLTWKRSFSFRPVEPQFREDKDIKRLNLLLISDPGNTLHCKPVAVQQPPSPPNNSESWRKYADPATRLTDDKLAFLGMELFCSFPYLLTGKCPCTD
ncbi:hypothetical protein C2845_PM01G09730 [Panicum miliaceum]|uniref:Uncharacterized protein n=1 Tax=Panicum miliaceum TaxID=4540 RepID=A0A3L6TK26_PANMI|nr:hypothetical protein C2845_PM01G09730 [Panicum miliaceum]